MHDRRMVDPTRENWNRIFSEIERLNERLDLLDIDELMDSNDA